MSIGPRKLASGLGLLFVLASGASAGAADDFVFGGARIRCGTSHSG